METATTNTAMMIGDGNCNSKPIPVKKEAIELTIS